MKTYQKKWSEPKGWTAFDPSLGADSAQLALVFGATSVLHQNAVIEEVQRTFPRALLFGCSTAGEICDTVVSENSVVITGVHFERTELHGAQTAFNATDNSFMVRERLACALPEAVTSTRDGQAMKLAHVLVLSDGLKVNGSDLVSGLCKHLPPGINVTGGLAGDGERFKETLVLYGGMPQAGRVAVLGLYGDRIRVGFGSLGGWDPFGPDRLITRSRGNVLYEFDGHSALGLYKAYLGEHAKGLPATGLLFPLSLRVGTGQTRVVRTILGINEEEQSMTFAGDLPEGSYAQLMKANVDRLIDGAMGAAKTCHQAIDGASADLALLISCVGRKLVLQQRVEEEVESVRDVLGAQPVMTGFYSYGEISPFTPGARCELHNQTMTVTTLKEI